MQCGKGVTKQKVNEGYWYWKSFLKSSTVLSWGTYVYVEHRMVVHIVYLVARWLANDTSAGASDLQGEHGMVCLPRVPNSNRGFGTLWFCFRQFPAQSCVHRLCATCGFRHRCEHTRDCQAEPFRLACLDWRGQQLPLEKNSISVTKTSLFPTKFYVSPAVNYRTAVGFPSFSFLLNQYQIKAKQVELPRQQLAYSLSSRTQSWEERELAVLLNRVPRKVVFDKVRTLSMQGVAGKAASFRTNACLFSGAFIHDFWTPHKCWALFPGVGVLQNKDMDPHHSRKMFLTDRWEVCSTETWRCCLEPVSCSLLVAPTHLPLRQGIRICALEFWSGFHMGSAVMLKVRWFLGQKAGRATFSLGSLALRILNNNLELDAFF